MEVKNCPECGRLFNFIRTNLCPVCVKEAEEEFQVVRKYLRDHPNVSILELSEATDIEEEKIIRWIEEGRLESKLFRDAPLKCEKCGTAIYSGRQCGPCGKGLVDELSRASQELSEAERQRRGVRMHTRIDKK